MWSKNSLVKKCHAGTSISMVFFVDISSKEEERNVTWVNPKILERQK